MIWRILVAAGILVPFVYLWGYETTRYVIWWRFHDRFAWWKTIREEWHRL